jgi:molybdenum cofactor biosynthesis protein B
MVPAMPGHSHHAQDAIRVGCAVITVSDTRDEHTDTSGQRIRELLTEAGHRIEEYRIVKDEPALITAAICSTSDEAEIIITNGGTGIAQRDTTFEAVSRMIDKEISGFGELFRMLSFEQIGAAAMMSRATAGVVGRRVVFCLPGSTKAVDLAMTRLILPQLGHVVGLVRGAS